MTEDQKLVDAALERFNGNRELAATALGRSIDCVYHAISKSDELMMRWGKFNGMDGQKLTRPHINGTLVDPSDKLLVQSIIHEDALLAEGLERLGLTPTEVERAVGMQLFGQNQFVQSVQIVGASMTTICVQLSTQLKEVIARLASVREELAKCGTPITRALLVEEEKFLSESLIGMAEQVRRMSDTAHRGMMLQAMIRFKLSGRRTGKDRSMPKPGFTTGSIPVETELSEETK